jgi:cell division septum initiation protein DivIVA
MAHPTREQLLKEVEQLREQKIELEFKLAGFPNITTTPSTGKHSTQQHTQHHKHTAVQLVNYAYTNAYNATQRIQRHTTHTTPHNTHKGTMPQRCHNAATTHNARHSQRS